MRASEERIRYEAAPAGDDPPPAASGAPPPPQAQQTPSVAGPTFAARADSALDPRRKSPALACILSLMPGLGQIYIGYYKLGFVHALVFAGTIMVLASAGDDLGALFGPFLGFFYLYNVVDAGRRAAFYNHALAGMKGIELPTDINLPLPGGSMVGGAILIVVGFVLLSNTLLGIPWYWLEQWWPVAPILFGVWLFVKGLQERAQKGDEKPLG